MHSSFGILKEIGSMRETEECRGYEGFTGQDKEKRLEGRLVLLWILLQILHLS